MNIGEVLEKRRKGWEELETLCDQMQRGRRRFRMRGEELLKLSALYRAACSDLALAEQYKLPPTAVEYLHRLVGRAHNQLYRANNYDISRWGKVMFHDAPKQIFSDACVHVAGVVFFGLFILSAILSASPKLFPNYLESVVGDEAIAQMEKMYAEPVEGNFDHYIIQSAFYIQHNTGIGLTCFGEGPLIIPTICTLAYNAVSLGAIFGYMARPEVECGDNFFNFVTAHGPFELTAIALSAAAGLRLGVGIIYTLGLRRIDSFRLQATRALPVVMVAVILFVLAAFTEGCISPTNLPYLFKLTWAIMSSLLMTYYFVILGSARKVSNAT